MLSENNFCIGLVLKRLSNLFKRRVDEIQSQIPSLRDVTSVQGWVICFIYDQYYQQKDVFQRDIEIELNIRKSSATTLLQRMEKNGFLVRMPLAHDARWKKLVLTEKAIDFRNEIKARIARVEAFAISGITANELSQFMNVADAIKRNLERYPNKENFSPLH